MSLKDELRRLFDEKGAELYAGEPVTQTDHALQCGTLAAKEEAGDEMVTAAFLHDVGHLLHDLGEDCADDGIDDEHEILGAKWIAERFPESVTKPVELHVAAKRYLCATDQHYFSCLSPASIQSLNLQGGPMSEKEQADFEAHPFFKEALMLRRWDEAGKVVGYEVKPLEYFLDAAERVAV